MNWFEGFLCLTWQSHGAVYGGERHSITKIERSHLMGHVYSLCSNKTRNLVCTSKEFVLGWAYGSVVEHLPSIPKILDSMPTPPHTHTHLIAVYCILQTTELRGCLITWLLSSHPKHPLSLWGLLITMSCLNSSLVLQSLLSSVHPSTISSAPGYLLRAEASSLG